VGSESLIKGEGGNESKKSEKVTTKSVIFSFKILSIGIILFHIRLEILQHLKKH